MRLRHFVDTQDYSPVELHQILALARCLKAADKIGACPPLLSGASLGMLFEEPSTRTRISFEVAMTKLGGHALYLRPGEIHLGVRESLADTANVLERMVDVIEARTLKHATVLGLADQADVPVINGLTDYNHPTQVLCDVMTMQEHAPQGKLLDQLSVTFVGDATNVCNSLASIATQLGMRFVHCAPRRYQISDSVREICTRNCEQSGATWSAIEDPSEAVASADFLYTDLWWWVGQEEEIPERRKAFMPKYQLNAQLLAKAPKHCKVMHCMPASRGVEITDEAMDGEQSIVFDQAENRLHLEKALLCWLVYPRLQRPSDAVKAYHAGRAESFLAAVVGT